MVNGEQLVIVQALFHKKALPCCAESVSYYNHCLEGVCTT